MTVSMRNAYGLLGIPLDAITMDETIRRVYEAADAIEQLTLTTPNLNFLRNALEDPSFRASLLVSDLSVVDGVPLLWLARLLGVPALERVAGATLFERLRAGCRPLRIFFFGGEDGVGERACASLGSSGSLECVGFESAGFGNVEDLSAPEYFQCMNAVGADFLVVSLGAIKGEAWIMHNRDCIAIPVVANLGAVINFTAGRIRRAPVWVQRLALEWLWRIFEEPSLWQRYFRDGVAFLRLLLFNALPYALWLRRHRRAADAPLSIKISQTPDGSILHLTGAFSDANRAVYEKVFAQLWSGPDDISFDLRGVDFLDPAGLGAILQLEGRALRHASVLRITNLTAQLRPVFRWNAMTHLLV